MWPENNFTYGYSSMVKIIASKLKSRFFLNHKRSELRYFSCGDDFFYDFNAFLRATFKLHIQRPCNTHGARLLYNSDWYVAFECKKTHYHKQRNCYYLPPLSQLQFLFTNERSTSGIVVLCSNQKFLKVSQGKIYIKIKIEICFKNRTKIDQN